jgi:hypothetical protein
MGATPAAPTAPRQRPAIGSAYGRTEERQAGRQRGQAAHLLQIHGGQEDRDVRHGAGDDPDAELGFRARVMSTKGQRTLRSTATNAVSNRIEVINATIVAGCRETRLC